MKRSASPPTSSSVNSDEYKPEIATPPTTKAKPKTTPNKTFSPSDRAEVNLIPTKKHKHQHEMKEISGDWTPEKKARFVDIIINTGYKSANLDDIASELGLSKRQLVNQLQPGRKGSLRDKAIQAARGDK